MAQHDYVIDNQTAPNFRADLNNALSAIVSTNSGTSAPTTTYANMMWYDTTNNLLRMRNEADDAWITLGTLDQVGNTFSVAGLTSAAIIAGLGFTPVQQGGGASQGTNKIYLGWDGDRLRLQVDASDIGKLALQSEIPAAFSVSSIASTGYGAVGSYSLLQVFAGVTVAGGATRAGSDLRYATAFGLTGSAPAGTWRNMGGTTGAGGSDPRPGATTLWLRIS